MRYSVEVGSYGDVSLSKGPDWVDLRLMYGEEEHDMYLSFEEFKEFRRAIGYVQTEIEEVGA